MRNARKLRPIPLWSQTSNGRRRWDKENLEKRRGEGERAFARGFQMRAYTDDELSFPSFSQCEKVGISLGDIIRSGWVRITGVDLSSKKRPGNCIVTAAFDPYNARRYLIDVRYGDWRSPETARQISEVNLLFRPTVIMVEDNAYQEALIDWVSDRKDEHSWWAKVEPTTTTGGKKASAELGLPSLEVEFKNGAWVFPLSEYQDATPDDSDPKRAAFARLASEFRHHPFYGTTDGVMATWFVRQGFELWGGLGMSGGDDLGGLTVR